MELLLVGIGGACGSLARYQIGKAIAQRSKATFPINTYMINIIGAVILGLLSGLNVDRNLYLIFGEGFSGAFTTFSTLMYEGFNMFKDNEKKNAIIYISSTLFLGIVGYTLGYYAIRWLIRF